LARETFGRGDEDKVQTHTCVTVGKVKLRSSQKKNENENRGGKQATHRCDKGGKNGGPNPAQLGRGWTPAADGVKREKQD